MPVLPLHQWGPVPWVHSLAEPRRSLAQGRLHLRVAQDQAALQAPSRASAQSGREAEEQSPRLRPREVTVPAAARADNQIRLRVGPAAYRSRRLAENRSEARVSRTKDRPEDLSQCPRTQFPTRSHRAAVLPLALRLHHRPRQSAAAVQAHSANESRVFEGACPRSHRMRLRTRRRPACQLITTNERNHVQQLHDQTEREPTACSS